MDRLFLDACVIYAATFVPNSGLRRLWAIPDTEAVTSSYAFGEAQRNLLRLGPFGKFESEEHRAKSDRLLAIARRTRIVEVEDHHFSGEVPLGLPPKDQPIFLGAMVTNSTHLITLDKDHFGKFIGQSINGVLITIPTLYLASKDA